MQDETIEIIGGLLGARFARPSPVPAYLTGGTRFVNARSALAAALTGRKVRTAWIPSYLCESILDPLKASGTPFKFYPVNARLECHDDSWISEVSEDDVVLGIHYFGLLPFPHFGSLSASGACLVEDLSQALFQPRDPAVDFTFYSLRKFLPVMDGGLLFGIIPSEVPQPLDEAEQHSFFGPASAAFFGRGIADRGDDTKFDWFQSFRLGESLAPCGAIAISKTSSWIFDNLIDFESIETQRRLNFRVLHQHLESFSPFENLPNDAAALGYPIVVRDRKALLERLYASRIYPPIHWNLKGIVPSDFRESHLLASSILTLPCDHRYSWPQMEMQLEIVMNHAEHADFP